MPLRVPPRARLQRCTSVGVVLSVLAVAVVKLRIAGVPVVVVDVAVPPRSGLGRGAATVLLGQLLRPLALVLIAEETGGAGIVAVVVSARRRELLPHRLSVQLHRPRSGLGRGAGELCARSLSTWRLPRERGELGSSPQSSSRAVASCGDVLAGLLWRSDIWKSRSA